LIWEIDGLRIIGRVIDVDIGEVSGIKYGDIKIVSQDGREIRFKYSKDSEGDIPPIGSIVEIIYSSDPLPRIITIRISKSAAIMPSPLRTVSPKRNILDSPYLFPIGFLLFLYFGYNVFLLYIYMGYLAPLRSIIMFLSIMVSGKVIQRLKGRDIFEKYRFPKGQITSLALIIAVLIPLSHNLVTIQWGHIEIDSDEDFTKQGWLGNGTAENPFLLSGITISRSGGNWNPAISISDTSKHFIIRNCYIGAGGIEFSNITYGCVENCFISGGEQGITLSECEQCVIQENEIITDNKWGVLVFKGGYHIIAGNSIRGGSYGGIFGLLSSTCLIANNSIVSEGAITLEDCSYWIIMNNLIQRGNTRSTAHHNGIWIKDSSNYIIIDRNNIQNFDHHGIYCAGRFVYIYNNTIGQNRRNGINIVGREGRLCSNIEIISNEVHHNLRSGIAVHHSISNVIANHLHDNTQWGIYSADSTINHSDNIFENNGAGDIFEDES
jgi:hypothetical protein